ncbi:hypothetical protein OCU04_004470 [Sclerotinia nivalis]|uniref:Uncharacterized protein n=1 Tax=Sclerotinia nivalis TaxID=352851 RepID=A0A9X0AQH7_9HELO|nr:hypothetical protein OCU04_004470 [Sclerotinia nivalis]
MLFAFLDVTRPVTGIVISVEGGFQIIVAKAIKGQIYAVLTGFEEFINEETIVTGQLLLPLPSQ